MEWCTCRRCHHRRGGPFARRGHYVVTWSLDGFTWPLRWQSVLVVWNNGLNFFFFFFFLRNKIFKLSWEKRSFPTQKVTSISCLLVCLIASMSLVWNFWFCSIVCVNFLFAPKMNSTRWCWLDWKYEFSPFLTISDCVHWFSLWELVCPQFRNKCVWTSIRIFISLFQCKCLACCSFTLNQQLLWCCACSIFFAGTHCHKRSVVNNCRQKEGWGGGRRRCRYAVAGGASGCMMAALCQNVWSIVSGFCTKCERVNFWSIHCKSCARHELWAASILPQNYFIGEFWYEFNAIWAGAPLFYNSRGTPDVCSTSQTKNHVLHRLYESSKRIKPHFGFLTKFENLLDLYPKLGSLWKANTQQFLVSVKSWNLLSTFSRTDRTPQQNCGENLFAVLLKQIYVIRRWTTGFVKTREKSCVCASERTCGKRANVLEAQVRNFSNMPKNYCRRCRLIYLVFFALFWNIWYGSFACVRYIFWQSNILQNIVILCF